MKRWKREAIEYGAILIFAMLAWWWVSNEYKKTHQEKVVSSTQEEKQKPIKIYSGIWKKGGYLEVQK